MKGMELLIKQTMDTINKGARVKERPCEKYSVMKINGMMKFHVKQYELEDIGNLSVMTVNMGIMKMASIVITPVKKDLPLVSADYIYIMGKRKAYIEVYDLPAGEQDAELRNKMYQNMEAIKAEYKDIEDFEATKAWYEDLLAFTTYKSGKKNIDSKINELLCRILSEYFEKADGFDVLTSEKISQKVAAVKNYTDGLIGKGGVSTDVFKKSLGEEATRAFFDETFFGTAYVE